MAITYPYALTVLADRLKISDLTWNIKRNDQISGTGDNRVWQAELADPLWTAEVKLSVASTDDAEEIAALIRKLHGAQELFWLYNPVKKYPKADPTGSILGSNAVKVDAVGSGMNTLSLKGLPAGYVLTLGDKGQVTFPTTETFFFEFSETVTADGTGDVTAEVFPFVPVGVAADDVVTLIKPACKMFIYPDTHNPGAVTTVVTDGAAFTAVERRR